MFLHSLAYFFSVWLLKNKFQVGLAVFLFSSLLQRGRGKVECTHSSGVARLSAALSTPQIL